MKPEQVVKFLEDFRQLIGGKDSAKKLISLRVPGNLLSAFKQKAQNKNIKYQTQIVSLMRAWIKEP